MPVNIKIKNLPEGYQSIITNGRHTVIGDEPVKSKGTDLGFDPAEFVLAGLAHCKVATVRYAARKKGWDLHEVYATLQQTITRQDGRFHSAVAIQLRMEGTLSPEQKAALLKEADNCYVHRLLNGTWAIEPATLEETPQ